MRNRSPIRPTLIATLLILGMVALPTTPAPAVGTCSDAPSFVPVADLTPGLMGTGWTAVEGQTPVSFDVEILGTLPDGIAPGVDFVLIEVSGPVVEEFGGIASGMSGSPVYVGENLVGAVSYGFSFANQFIGGLTPAENMLDLFEYPDAASPAAASIELSPSLRSVASRAVGEPLTLGQATAEPLPVPLSVSGLSPHGKEVLTRRFEKQDLPFTVERGGSGRAALPSGPLPGEQPEPGEPVAAMLSYGDVSAGGVGTQTAVCGDLSIAFGHPFSWLGRTTIGMNEASILKVISDPSGIFGPFKLASIGEPAGVIDQDRITGIRGFSGVAPPTVAVTSELSNPELGTTKLGETKVVTPMALPDLGGFHLAQAIWDSNDTWWGGTARLRWVIEGEREGGPPFSLSYENAFYNDYDVGFEAYIYLSWHLYSIQENEIEPATITSVAIEGETSQDRETSKLKQLRTTTTVQPTTTNPTKIKAARGRRITVEVDLDPYQPGSDRTESVAIKVPNDAPRRLLLMVYGGSQSPSGGGSAYYGYSGYYGYGDEPETLDELLASLTSGFPGDDLVVGLYETGDEDSAPQDVVEAGLHQPDIVRGSRIVVVRVV